MNKILPILLTLFFFGCDSGIMPPANSTMAGEIDSLYYFILWCSTVIFGIVVFFIIYFCIKYRNESVRDKLEEQVSHNSKIEIFWTTIPTILICIVFFWGAKDFIKMQVPPNDSEEILVTASNWQFEFNYRYKGGMFSVSDSLVIPQGKPVKLLMGATKNSFIHSFYIPNFRVKQDVMPNRYSQVWFQSNDVGTYDYYCTEYCGVGHSGMNGHVIVMPEFSEPFTDLPDEEYNKGEVFDDLKNDKWDEGERFEDLNGNKEYDEGEKYVDGNGRWDAEEPFEDLNGNKEYDEGEKFIDLNDNQIWDAAEKFEDTMGNGKYDEGEAFEDLNANGKWDTGYDYWMKRQIAKNEALDLLTGVERGEWLYNSVQGKCVTCHSNGENVITTGPSFKGLFGTTVTHTDGSTAVVDEDYIERSIRYPREKIVENYGNEMPLDYENWDKKDIDAIIEYIKTLK